MNTTIYDVAKLAKVSISTVSRVLNNKDRVSPKTHQRVLDAISELDFHPNINATGLAVSKTGIIGARIFSFDDVSIPDTFALEYLRGIQDVLYERDYHLLIISDSKTDIQGKKPDCMKLINSKRMDGLIVYSSQVHIDPIKDMVKTKFPIIISGEYTPFLETLECSSICYDYYEYAKVAIAELALKGHHHIGIVTYAETEYEFSERVQIYQRIFNELGLTFNNSHLINGAIDKNNIWLKISNLVDSQSLTAIYACNVHLAQQAIDGVQKLNLKVHDDVSLVCLEHAKGEGTWINPSISGVYVNSLEIGSACARLLFHIIEGQNKDQHLKIQSPILADRKSVKNLKI